MLEKMLKQECRQQGKKGSVRSKVAEDTHCQLVVRGRLIVFKWVEVSFEIFGVDVLLHYSA